MIDSYYNKTYRSPKIDPLTYTPFVGFMYWKEPLKPTLNETFCLLSPGVWSIGSLMMCEKLEDGPIPADAVCSWNDGSTYYLRKRSPPRVDQEPEGDFLASKHGDHNGPERGIWTISPNVFCKVKGWVEGFTTEATTIRWLNKNIPSVPTEEIIYDWIDPEWNRVIMITKRVPGETSRRMAQLNNSTEASCRRSDCRIC
jgi:hypothetical protein